MTSNERSTMNVYEKTIDRFNTHGWLQYRPCSSDGAACLLGGLALSQGATIDQVYGDEFFIYKDNEHTKKIAGIIKEQFPEWYDDAFPGDIARFSNVCYLFNDDHTKDQVISVLEKAAVSEVI